MARDFLGVALWRWAAFASGLGFLALALGLAAVGDPVFGTCLHPGTGFTLGHCPLCWASLASFLFAAAPRLPRPARIRVRVRG